jgi:hypothetical protein
VDACVQTVFHDGQLLFENIEKSEAADAYVQNHLPSLYPLCPDISSINNSIDYNFSSFRNSSIPELRIKSFKKDSDILVVRFWSYFKRSTRRCTKRNYVEGI